MEIIDSGPGFPEIVLKKHFQTFTTVDDMTKQGMGLDLALIKLIIEAHQGTITINNNDSGGATVAVSV